MIFYIVIDHAVLRRRSPLRCGLIFLPVLYFVCVAVNVFAIMYEGSSCKVFKITFFYTFGKVWLFLSFAFS